MYRNIREALASREREEGFTLIELLVVVIIIGILAAVAIPVFLNQREKAWDSAAKSDLRNAATAQESYFTDENTYTTLTGDPGLAAEGFQGSDDVTLTVASASTTAYCMDAKHDLGGKNWYLSSATGAPVEGSCTP